MNDSNRYVFFKKSLLMQTTEFMKLRIRMNSEINSKTSLKHFASCHVM